MATSAPFSWSVPENPSTAPVTSCDAFGSPSALRSSVTRPLCGGQGKVGSGTSEFVRESVERRLGVREGSFERQVLEISGQCDQHA